MREVEVSDDPEKVWLSPERCRAARAILNWTPAHLAALATQAGRSVTPAEIVEYEDFGLALDLFTAATVLAILFRKVEFTTSEGEPGVVRKHDVGAAQGEGYIQFGGKPRRRRPL